MAADSSYNADINAHSYAPNEPIHFAGMGRHASKCKQADHMLQKAYENMCDIYCSTTNRHVHIQETLCLLHEPNSYSLCLSIRTGMKTHNRHVGTADIQQTLCLLHEPSNYSLCLSNIDM